MELDFDSLGFAIPRGRTSGNVKIICPECAHTRRNRRDKSLSVNLDTGLFLCHHCGYSGTAARYSEQERKEFGKRMQANRSYQTAPPRRPAASPWRNPRAQAIEKRAYPTPQPKGGPLAEKTIAYLAGRGISAATAEAFGVRQGELYSHRRRETISAILFPYYHRGQLRNIKSRSALKEFTLEKGCELLPYNIDAIRGKKECVITEGEFDALAFAEAGVPYVVSVPNGANANLAYLDAYMEEYFDDKRTIYIAVDTDPAGIGLRDELLRRFGADRCRVVTFGPDCKDPNELLVREGKQALLDALNAAPETRMDGITTLRDFESELDALYRHGMQRGATLGFAELDNFISFETKRLCIVTGTPGSGKSEFIDQMAERLNLRYGWKFAYFTPENAPAMYHAVKMIEKYTGKKFGESTLPPDEYVEAKFHIDDNIFYIDPTENLLDEILDCAAFLVRRKGIKALVIDPYNRIESQMGDTSETLYISTVLDRLTEFAQLHDVMVILVAHPKKMMRGSGGKFETPTLYDISGSANFFNKADFGIVIDRDFREDSVLVSVQKVKFKHLGKVGNALFKYDIQTGRYVTYVNGYIPEFDRDNHLRNGAQILTEESPPPPFKETEDQLPF